MVRSGEEWRGVKCKSGSEGDGEEECQGVKQGAK